MKALITRPQPDAGAFAGLCAGAGIGAVVAPLMEIAVRRAPVSLKGAGAVAFTSANGVRAFAANCARRDIPVFAVGQATGAAAAAAGFGAVRTAGGDVESLAALIGENRGRIDGAVLHPAGTRLAGDLVAALDAHGVRARRLTLYETLEAQELPRPAVDALISDPPVDWVALFSPRSAELFARLVAEAGLADRLERVRAACLSGMVAAAAGPLGWRSVETAPTRTAEAMVALMAGNA